MLGERKTRGVFNEGRNSEWSARMQELMPAQTAPAEPVVREPAEVVNKSADDIFFAAVEGKDFATVLQEEGYRNPVQRRQDGKAGRTL